MEHPDPVIERDDDVLVRVRAASICGSDTHGYDGKNGRRVPPLVMGHEASGEVVTVGPAVTAVAPGDRVFVMPMHWCGSCDACRNGRFCHLCPDPQGLWRAVHLPVPSPSCSWSANGPPSPSPTT